MPQCSLLTALQELEDRKLVESGWTASDLYRITAGGRVHLEGETTHWTKLAKAIDLILHPAKDEVL